MKIVADEFGRLSAADLFQPNMAFEVSRQPDGTFRIAPISEVPVVKPRRVNGMLRGAAIELSRETVAAAVRADRDDR